MSIPPSQISVAILTYNSQDYIVPCLESVLASGGVDFDILVIDNASFDASAAIVRERFPGIRIIVNPCNMGVAGGWNQAWRETAGEIIVILNPDVELAPDCLRALAEAFAAHPEAAAAGAKLFYMDRKTLQHCGAGLYPNAQSFHRGAGEEDHGQYDTLEAVPFVTGAVFAVRRSALEALGGFDEDYYPAYYEEADFCFRAAMTGRRTLYVPRAVAYHHEAVTLKLGSSRFVRLYHRMRALFLVKNFSWKRILFEALPFECKIMRYAHERAHLGARLAAGLWAAPYVAQRIGRKLRGLPGRPFDCKKRERPAPKVVPSAAIEEAMRRAR